MKIEFIKEKLQGALVQAERSVGKNLSLPILSNIILEIKNKKLTVKATNLEIGVELQVLAKVDGEKTVAIPPGVLTNLLQNLPADQKVEMEDQEDTLVLQTAKGQVTIKTVNPEDFPVIPRVTTGLSCSLPSESLVEGIRSVSYAAALSDIKPEIASVYIYSNDGDLVFVATDSFRLSEKRITLKTIPTESFHLIIPLKNASEIARILSDYGGDTSITLTTDGNQISLFTDNLHITSRIIDGVYPDYRQIMPKDFKTTFTIDREELISTLKLAGVFSDKSNRLLIEFTDGTFRLSTKNSDIGESSLTIIPKSTQGEAVTMTINSRYLLDVFQSFSEKMVSLKFNEPTRPLYIKGEGNETFQALVMPLRS